MQWILTDFFLYRDLKLVAFNLIVSPDIVVSWRQQWVCKSPVFCWNRRFLLSWIRPVNYLVDVAFAHNILWLLKYFINWRVTWIFWFSLLYVHSILNNLFILLYLQNHFMSAHLTQIHAWEFFICFIYVKMVRIFIYWTLLISLVLFCKKRFWSIFFHLNLLWVFNCKVPVI